MLIFRQLFDPQSSTYTYLLGDSGTRQVVLIDPVFEQVRRDAALIEELGLELLYTLDTHVHADHVTGSWLLKECLGSQILLGKQGGALSENDFAGYMNNLGLAHPKQMDIAVPANLRCGRPDETRPLYNEPDWAPLNYTFAGIWEIQPQWVEEHLTDVQILDVREPDEFDGPLGHIPGAKLIPLGNLGKQLDEISKGQPIVTVCRAGGRSARASLMLQQAGLPNVANLAGGILRWRAQNLTVLGAADD